MFSIKTYDAGVDDGYLGVTLVFDYQGFKIELTPEYQEKILKINIDAESGKFETSPNNGCFSFSWTPSLISFYVDRCGDGQGGSIHINFPSTSEMLDSLHQALHQWKEICQENESEN